MMYIKRCIKPNPPLLVLIIAVMIGIISSVILWVLNYTALIGPVLGAMISVIAVLGNETAKYYSSTSTLKLSLGLEQTVDPGLDVEVFERTCRISAVVVNSGRTTVKYVKAALTIKVRRNKQEDYYLGNVLLRKNEIINFPNCRGYLVNEDNPHVIGEMLSWALPERIITRPSTDYVHITSISPGQRSRLLIFEYTKLSDDMYLVMPFSEYGAPGPSDPPTRPYRACLKLDRSSELVMKVTVHGEGARSPLEFTLCVTFDKLAKIDDAIVKLKNAKGEDQKQKFTDLLKALNSLICHYRSK
ncbi:MAG: hypothetical protein QXO02_05830 [Thermofilaceae archaeon]|uniref:hypothetical protein n=1 Tax=Pyrobaculum sp. TaxID=2004705 RepID=UPI00315E82EF